MKIEIRKNLLLPKFSLLLIAWGIVFLMQQYSWVDRGKWTSRHNCSLTKYPKCKEIWYDYCNQRQKLGQSKLEHQSQFCNGFIRGLFQEKFELSRLYLHKIL